MRTAGLRVIAGALRGRRVAVPSGVRPTRERAREAVFSAVHARLDDASVLDCYAGSGIGAIEALSRGARCAVLVEQDPQVAAVARANVRDVGLESVCRVVVADAHAFFVGDPPPEAPFSVVFADPPYGAPTASVRSALDALERDGWLAEDAVLALEQASRSDPCELGAGWHTRWVRSYGSTLVTLALRQAANQANR